MPLQIPKEAEKEIQKATANLADAKADANVIVITELDGLFTLKRKNITLISFHG